MKTRTEKQSLSLFMKKLAVVGILLALVLSLTTASAISHVSAGTLGGKQRTA